MSNLSNYQFTEEMLAYINDTTNFTQRDMANFIDFKNALPAHRLARLETLTLAGQVAVFKLTDSQQDLFWHDGTNSPQTTFLANYLT